MIFLLVEHLSKCEDLELKIISSTLKLETFRVKRKTTAIPETCIHLGSGTNEPLTNTYKDLFIYNSYTNLNKSCSVYVRTFPFSNEDITL